MIARLEAELKHEREVLAKRRAEGRGDYIALALLSRIEREIETLEWRLKHERRKSIAKHKNTATIQHSIKEAFRRYRANCYGYYMSVRSLFTRNTLQETRGIK